MTTTHTHTKRKRKRQWWRRQIAKADQKKSILIPFILFH
jgi:hypothetical protein